MIPGAMQFTLMLSLATFLSIFVDFIQYYDIISVHLLILQTPPNASLLRYVCSVYMIRHIIMRIIIIDCGMSTSAASALVRPKSAVLLTL